LCLVTNKKPRQPVFGYGSVHITVKIKLLINDIICQLSWVDIEDIFGLAGVFWQIAKSKSREISEFSMSDKRKENFQEHFLGPILIIYTIPYISPQHFTELNVLINNKKRGNPHKHNTLFPFYKN